MITPQQVICYNKYIILLNWGINFFEIPVSVDGEQTKHLSECYFHTN